jgi:hypothetical protein
MTEDLDEILREAAPDEGCTLDDLTVLSKTNDPYRAGTPAKWRDAEWVARQFEHFKLTRPIHIRGLHYRLVAAGNIRKPNGSVYVNTDPDYAWLNMVCCYARWLGLVPIHMIIDQRNDDPWLPPEPDTSTEPSTLDVERQIVVPDLGDLLPRFSEPPVTVRQPFHLVLIGEKSSLRPDLLPIAREFGAELILLAGENSISRVYEMLVRADRNGRPVRCFYFSDFDPYGWHMPVAVARKIQAMRDQYFPELDLVLYRVALDEDQVHRYNLPPTPLKETDDRCGPWRERFGRDATEIDALIALHPGVLEQLARTALSPFFDGDLDDRIAGAQDEWRAEATDLVEEHPEYDAVRERIEAAREKVAAAVEELDKAQQHALDQLSDLEPPELEVEEVDLDDEPGDEIFTTEADFVTATQQLIDIKEYAA